MQVVTYLRVSTRRQGESGLGLEAQRAAVLQYASRSDATILREFQEVESGKKTDAQRPALREALAYAKRAGATLVVAKLDRLARNLAFLTRLMEEGVPFVACDNPHANKITIHILAAVAETERDMISARTKAGLAAAKAKGVKLGSSRPGHWNGHEAQRAAGLKKAQRAGAAALRSKAVADYADLLPRMRRWRTEEGADNALIATSLNAEGHRTRTGRHFDGRTVARILDRERSLA